MNYHFSGLRLSKTLTKHLQEDGSKQDHLNIAGVAEYRYIFYGEQSMFHLTLHDKVSK